MIPRIVPLITASLLALLTTQCASGPDLARVVTVAKGDRVLVSIRSGPMVQTLLNNSSLTDAEAQDQLARDPNLKIVPDAFIQALLDVFGGQQFFRLATFSEQPAKPASILVHHNGKNYVALGRQKEAADMARWGRCMNRFLDVYNANDRFRSATDEVPESPKTP